MPRRGDRGGTATRARIAAVATDLFLQRGFDEVTVAEVAAAAGVSKVTVFSHFDRKEDLLLDELPTAVDLVREAIRDRAPDTDAVEALYRAALDLARQRHPLSGLGAGEVEPFMRTVLAAPSLVDRLREFAFDLETAVAAELPPGRRNTLLAAMAVTAWRTVYVETVRRRLHGEDLEEVADSHERRLAEAFDLIRHGVAAPDRPGPDDRR